MSDGTFVKEMRAGLATPLVSKVGDREVLSLPQGWSDGTPAHITTQVLTVRTLAGLAEFVKSNRDNVAESGEDSYLIHVANPTEVYLRGSLGTEDKGYRRHTYLKAEASLPDLTLGSFMDHDAFMIHLQTRFEKTDQRDSLMKMLGSIRENDVRNSDDDGIAQQITVSKGITMAERVSVPSPVELRPYRTFHEVPQQPASPFVLRVRKGTEKPMVALFEADGGAWRLEAIKAVADWLRANAQGVPIIA